MPFAKRISGLLVVTTLVACAQNATPAVPAVAPSVKSNLLADLDQDVAGVEKKMVDLAKAMPDASMDWRPMPGVRSVREVFLHIASENYLIPTFFGGSVPAATKISAGDDKSVSAYEGQKITKEQTVTNLQESFANLRAALAADTVIAGDAKLNFFGGPTTRERAWIGTVTHLHEHLGQAIAYARSNKVVPPWSK